MKKIIAFVFLILLNLDCLASDKPTNSYITGHSFPKKMIITVPVADLRKEPKSTDPNLPYPIFSKDNPLQESQLLLGEYILAFYEKKNSFTGKSWLQVYALEQTFYNGSEWKYKQGWIEKNQAMEVVEYPSYNLVVKNQWINVFSETSQDSDVEIHLSIGTKILGKSVTSQWYKVFLSNERIGYVFEEDIYYLKAQSNETEKSLRKQILEIAASFVDTPYSWGGRSGYNNVINDQLSYQPLGVDCSGFTNLVYRAVGLEIPRDAHDQFIKSNKLKSGKDLKPGDLIFFALTNNPKKIIHVGMFDIDDFFGSIIHESSGEWSNNNSRVPSEIKFGKKIENIKYGETCGKYVIYFGSFLDNSNIVTELRANSLKNYFAEFKGMNTNFTATTDSLDCKTTLTQN